MKRTLLDMNRHVVLCLSALLAANAFAVDIEPPKAQLVDKFGVNMANGQITHSLNTVSIGGAMGLSHSVSVDANEFNYKGYRGFRDKFLGEARNVQLSTNPANFSPLNILRVYDFLGSADFGYYANGVLQNGGSNLTSGYTYLSRGDERQILEVDANPAYLKWTHPDGTVSRFYRGVCAAANNTAPCADTYGMLVDVTYPNGFVVTITSGGMSVTTNTGFQLKAIYQTDNRSMDVSDLPNCANGSNGPAPCLYNAPPASSSSWAISNPAQIVGINNAYEYCTPTATTCSLTRPWPHADFHWPAGMPRRVYLAPTNTSDQGGMWVKDAKGQQTTYFIKPYDLALLDGAIKEGYVANVEFSPRISAIAPYGTTQALTYDYKNVWSVPQCYSGGGMSYGCWDYRLQNAGVVKQATKLALTASYTMNEANNSDIINYGYGLTGISRVQVRGQVQGTVGALYFAETDDGRYTFEASPRNFVTKFENANGPTADYTYTRSNVTQISYANGDSYVQASYPASCTATTRKTCNHADWTRDARGNYTYYWYHAPSGQVASVKSPADKNGISPQVRYEYTQLSAHYYNGGGSKITGSPIWMKTAERTCASSNTTYDPNTGSGSCNGGANDEIVTRYEYNNDNLLMTGMTVTAWDPVTSTSKTLRTCFKYDIYGNQIGKTQPKANLTQCN